MIRENEYLNKEITQLKLDKESLLKNKDMFDGQISALSKSLDSAQKDLKDKEKLVWYRLSVFSSACILSYHSGFTHEFLRYKI